MTPPVTISGGLFTHALRTTMNKTACNDGAYVFDDDPREMTMDEHDLWAKVGEQLFLSKREFRKAYMRLTPFQKELAQGFFWAKISLRVRGKKVRQTLGLNNLWSKATFRLACAYAGQKSTISPAKITLPIRSKEVLGILREAGNEWLAMNPRDPKDKGFRRISAAHPLVVRNGLIKMRVLPALVYPATIIQTPPRDRDGKYYVALDEKTTLCNKIPVTSAKPYGPDLDIEARVPIPATSRKADLVLIYQKSLTSQPYIIGKVKGGLWLQSE